MKGFIPYEDEEIMLPERGVVFITGPNGGGKSVMIDAISTTIWNKTIRGPLGWDEGKKCELEVAANDYAVKRSRTASGTLKLEIVDEPEYGTASKAQPFLNSTFGDQATWRNVDVFTSDDAGVFTEATDSERKQFIENMIGIDFEGARKDCGEDKRAVEKKIEVSERKAATLQERVRGLERSYTDAKKRLDEEQQPEEDDGTALTKLKQDEKAVRELMEECSVDLQDARNRKEKINEDRVRIRAENDTMRKQMQRLDHDKCPACGQDIDEKHRTTAKAQWDKQNLAYTAEDFDLVHALEPIDDEISEVREENQTLKERGVTLVRSRTNEESRLRELAKDLKRFEVAEAALKSTETEKQTAETELEAVKKESVEYEVELAELEAAEKVLGLRGFRAHLLGESLSGIEQVSNIWLERIAPPGVSLELRPVTENQDGTIAEKVSMKILGIGSGRGYYALSQGQRRRINVAMFFGLGEFRRGIRGTTPGTLWFDEVLDNLDEEGIAAVSAVIREIAADRPVVIISHNPELFDAIAPDVHYRVIDGKISG